MSEEVSSEANETEAAELAAPIPIISPIPTIGRIVIYSMGDVRVPAIVTAVYEDGVDLFVFTGDGQVLRQHVTEGKGSGHWAWPERS